MAENERKNEIIGANYAWNSRSPVINKGKFRRCSCISSVHREIGHFHVVVLSCSVCKRDRLIKPGCFSTERGCSKESDSLAPQRSSVAVREKSLRPAKS